MENPNFIFSSGPIELKEEGENFFVEGFISTSDLDLVNDIVTKDCIIDMADQMKERTVKLDVEHESFRGNTDLEREINKTIIPVAKIDDFLVDKKGLKVRAMLNKHVGRFNEVKNSIKDGFLDAFSIAFIPVESKQEVREGTEVRMLDKINLLNVAFTGNPVNTHSTMTNVFAKSLEFLEEKKKGPGGHTPDKTGPHGSGAGPGGGRADGSGIEDEEEDEKKKKKKKKEESYKSYDHENDEIKLKEVKNMTEDNKEAEGEKKEETQSEKKPESETEEKAKKKVEDDEEEDEDEEKKKKVSKKDEDPVEKEEPKAEEPNSSIEEEVKNLKKELTEIKAVLKRPMLKSKVEQVNKTGIIEEKSLNPLDVIA